jgi:hypothetical protein
MQIFSVLNFDIMYIGHILMQSSTFKNQNDAKRTLTNISSNMFYSVVGLYVSESPTLHDRVFSNKSYTKIARNNRP